MLYAISRGPGVAAALLLAAALATSACSEKAQALKVGTSQFRAESLQAIDAIDTMRRKEIAPAPRPNAEAAAESVTNLIELDPSLVNEPNVGTALDPYTVNLDQGVGQGWADFLARMRTQYRAFADIFREVDRASFTGREAIAKAEPLVAKLTAQMIHFADIIDANPPQLKQHRVALLDRLRSIKKAGANDAGKRQAVSLWRDQWLSLLEAERQLKRDTVAQCLKAATIGVEVRRQIKAYNEVTIEDITSAFDLAFRFAASITGNDYEALRARTSIIFDEIKNDEVWSKTSDIALRELNDALQEGAKKDEPGAKNNQPDANPDEPPSEGQ